MGTVKVTATTRVAPQRFVDALIDFDNRASGLWGNSDVSFLEVHHRGENTAEVTEGSKVAGGIWQRYRYDWSAPGVVRLDVLDGNAFGEGSWWEYRITERPDGGGVIQLTIHRKPTTRKGKLLEPFLRLGAPLFFGRDLRATLRRLEAQEQQAPGTG